MARQSKYKTEEERLEARRASVRRWMARNKPHMAKKAREWRAANPNKAKAARQRTRARHGHKYRAKEASRPPEVWRRYRESAKQKKLERQDILNGIKMSSGCIDCGYRRHPIALHFDHVRGEKTKEVSDFHTIAGMMAEVAKCDVRCANCHMIRHYLENPLIPYKVLPV